MPEKLDRCVESLMARWRQDPSKAPKRTRDGKPIETDADRKSAAFAMCRASTGLAHYPELTEEWVIALSDGAGPTLRGAAAVNDPHIDGMDRLQIVWRDGKEMIKGQLLRFGAFYHPKAPDGKLIFNQEIFDSLVRNFKAKTLGRVAFLDAKHEPNEGSLGEIVELEQVGDRLNVYVDPTPAGIQAIKDRVYNYLSAWINMNYKGTEVAMSFSDEGVAEIDIVEMAADLAEQEFEEGDMPESNDKPTTPDGSAGEVVQLTREQFDELKQSLAEAQQEASRVDDLLKETKEFEVELAKLHKLQAEREEDLRLQKVDLFIERLERPDKNGGMIDKGTLELLRVGLRNDPMGEGDAEIKLSGESTLSDVHRYYRSVLQQIGEKTPRVVPGGQEIEPDEDKVQELEARLSKRKAELETIALKRGMSDEEAEKFVEAKLVKLQAQVNGR